MTPTVEVDGYNETFTADLKVYDLTRSVDPRLSIGCATHDVAWKIRKLRDRFSRERNDVTITSDNRGRTTVNGQELPAGEVRIFHWVRLFVNN